MSHTLKQSIKTVIIKVFGLKIITKTLYAIWYILPRWIRERIKNNFLLKVYRISLADESFDKLDCSKIPSFPKPQRLSKHLIPNNQEIDYVELEKILK